MHVELPLECDAMRRRWRRGEAVTFVDVCISTSLSSSMTDGGGTGVRDIGGVNVGDTGIDKHVGTAKMFELVVVISSPWSKVEAADPIPSASSSAIGWNKKSLEWPHAGTTFSRLAWPGFEPEKFSWCAEGRYILFAPYLRTAWRERRFRRVVGRIPDEGFCSCAAWRFWNNLWCMKSCNCLLSRLSWWPVKNNRHIFYSASRDVYPARDSWLVKATISSALRIVAP